MATSTPAPIRPPASAQCADDAHEVCPGWRGIYARGAAYTDPPLLTVPCGCRACACGHRGEEQ
ncbi:hypothetical protein ACFQLX_07265 [Streptomyces polyrhachis]|uniref:Uncharacterized protein n=1 Tax=Streptomyces polyrhachis TaxID=1282885 RepID=A0ABW2GDW3_9ACTN